MSQWLHTSWLIGASAVVTWSSQQCGGGGVPGRQASWHLAMWKRHCLLVTLTHWHLAHVANVENLPRSEHAVECLPQCLPVHLPQAGAEDEGDVGLIEQVVGVIPAELRLELDDVTTSRTASSGKRTSGTTTACGVGRSRGNFSRGAGVETSVSSSSSLSLLSIRSRATSAISVILSPSLAVEPASLERPESAAVHKGDCSISLAN